MNVTFQRRNLSHGSNDNLDALGLLFKVLIPLSALLDSGQQGWSFAQPELKVGNDSLKPCKTDSELTASAFAVS